MNYYVSTHYNWNLINPEKSYGPVKDIPETFSWVQSVSSIIGAFSLEHFTTFSTPDGNTILILTSALQSPKTLDVLKAYPFVTTIDRNEITTFPFGISASSAKTARSKADQGVFSAGLVTHVHPPAASAAPDFRVIMAFGKFHYGKKK